jgi:subtilisin family serine protease
MRMAGGFWGRRAAAAAAITALVAGLASGTAGAAPPNEPGTVVEVADAVPGQYIVTLQDVSVSEVRPTAVELAEEHDGSILFTYRHALRGFAVEMSEADALALSQEPDVLRVEEDGRVHAVTTQSNPPWGLDRIDQRDLPLDQSYTYGNDGAGVRAYIIDTGIRRTHTDLGGRASIGFDAIGDGQNTNDCNGHGTHVAGTVGGATYGVAKAVSLVAVRVLNCGGSGSTSQVVAGVDWVTGNAVLPAVANMSLGGGIQPAIDTAVQNSVAAGITYAVAAGNETTNACNRSPARAPSALTVGATASNDTMASFSNFGSCVDLFAPGVGITSAWHTSDTATNTISGTSMASPHVAGVAARYLQANPTANPAAVGTAVTGNALENRVPCPNGSPNLLLFSAFLEGQTPGPVPPPPGGQANDAFANAQVLSTADGSVNGSTVCTGKEAGEPNHAGNAGGRSIWYRWTAPSNGPITIDTVGSSYDTLLAAYTGSAVNGLTHIASNDDGSGIGLRSRITFTANAGTTYRIAVDGYNGAAGSVTLNWDHQGTGNPKPDLLIRKGNEASYVGDGIYNVTAVGQQRFTHTPPGSMAVYWVYLQNDGTASDTVLLGGLGSAQGFNVRYYDITGDVTSEVTSASYLVEDLAPGEEHLMAVTVGVGSGRSPGDFHQALLMAVSTSQWDQRDAVKGTVVVA